MNRLQTHTLFKINLAEYILKAAKRTKEHVDKQLLILLNV